MISNKHSLLSGILLGVLLTGLSMGSDPASAGSPKDIQDQGKAMVRDAEDMVMHGGMGAGKAILHHCAEVTKQAQVILKVLPAADAQGQAARPHLQDAIRHCQRVAQLGDQADPGASLNPAVKARAAAREAVKHLRAMIHSDA